MLKNALDLDPENVNALLVEAELKLNLEFDLQGAISKLESLIRRFPNSIGYYYYFEMLAIALKTDEMLLVSERFQDIYPHLPNSAKTEFRASFLVGDFDRAWHTTKRSYAMVPVGEDRPWTGRKYWQIIPDIASGRFDAAEDNIKPLAHQMSKAHFLMWLAIERGQLDVARELYASSPKNISNMPWYWLPLDVVLTGKTSRTLDEIENPTNPNSIIWIMRLPLQDRWMSDYGARPFKEAFAALRKEPRYQRALLKYGIDDESLAKIQVHTDELWN